MRTAYLSRDRATDLQYTTREVANEVQKPCEGGPTSSTVESGRYPLYRPRMVELLHGELQTMQDVTSKETCAGGVIMPVKLPMASGGKSIVAASEVLGTAVTNDQGMKLLVR